MAIDKNKLLVEKRERLRKAYVKAGFDMDKEVDFWGKTLPLKDAINLFDKDDIRDGYKQISWNKYVDSHPENKFMQKVK